MANNDNRRKGRLPGLGGGAGTPTGANRWRFLIAYAALGLIVLLIVRGQAGTVELRQALVHYRSLFEELLESEEGVLTRS